MVSGTMRWNINLVLIEALRKPSWSDFHPSIYQQSKGVNEEFIPD